MGRPRRFRTLLPLFLLFLGAGSLSWLADAQTPPPPGKGDPPS